MAEMIFSYNGINTLIQCKIEEKLKDICERFCTKIHININELIFIYDGGLLNLDLDFNHAANENNKQNLKMNILEFCLLFSLAA